MKTNKHCGIFASLAIAWLAIAPGAQAGPEYTPNRVVETSAPGLARLEVVLSSKEWPESRRFVFEGKEHIAGGISLPEKYSAEYSMTAYDAEGSVINMGKGPIPPVAVLDKPFDVPLPAVDQGEGLLVTVNLERIALEAQPSKDNEILVHADVFDPAGDPAKIDPELLYWQLSDGRYLDLRRGFDPRDIHVVPHKDFELQQLCTLEPVVSVCTLNGHCREIKVCKDPWVKISASADYTCGLKESGLAFCWGLNMEGQLGAPTTGSCVNNSSNGPNCSARPLAVKCPPGSPCRFTQISAGTTITAAIDTNGDVWWWGRGAADHHRVNAVLAGSSVKFSQVAAGYGHACAISAARGEIWCWGANGYGETGVKGYTAGGPGEVPDSAPARVLAPLKFNRIVAGGEHTCAIGSTSVDIVCWGRDDSNQTSGPSSTQYSATGTTTFYFQQFGGLTNILDVSASGSSTCVTIAGANGVRCWGDLKFTNVGPFGAPDRISAGYNHVCALLNQQASCVGLNFWGEIGVGSNAPQGAPVNVLAPPALYSTLTTGNSHTCGITPDGDAFCWGRNFEGQIGNGATNFTTNKPTAVAAP